MVNYIFAAIWGIVALVGLIMILAGASYYFDYKKVSHMIADHLKSEVVGRFTGKALVLIVPGFVLLLFSIAKLLSNLGIA